MAKKWLFPLACIILVIISFLPLYTEIPYDPRNSQDVIYSILMISVKPFQDWGWIFHVTTLLLVLYILWKPDRAGRVLAGYMGINYLIIAAIQTHADTVKYGFALQTGALVSTALIGILCLIVAIRNSWKLSLENIPPWRYVLIPLALLTFWSPIKADAGSVVANFDPRLLITSADYGLSYCFATPVFLFLLILFTNDQTNFTFRVIAFNALLYGLFNLVHWFNPSTIWMGFLHLPLLILSLVALLLPYLAHKHREKPVLQPL